MHCHQQLPYSVADVELLLDEEAVAGWGPAATDALLRHAGDGAGVEALLAAVPMVAAAGVARGWALAPLGWGAAGWALRVPMLAVYVQLLPADEMIAVLAALGRGLHAASTACL